MDNNTRKKFIFLFLLCFVAIGCVFAAGQQNTRTQEIVLIAIVPPAAECGQFIYEPDANQIAASIKDLSVDNGVVINLENMSPEAVDVILLACIAKLADEIQRGAFQKGSNAGILIRTNNSQFKISQNGVAYTSMDAAGQGEIKRIIKSLAEDYSIDALHLEG